MRISKGFLSNLEKEVRQPSDQLLRLIAHEYSSSENWLATGEGQMFVFPSEIIERALEVLGEEKLLKAIAALFEKHNLLNSFSSDSSYAMGNDIELKKMLNFLIQLWSLEDEKLRNWAQVQFERSFPQDMIDKIKDKTASLKNNRTSSD
ncbi:hypothetical protein [Syntrophomonas palmitatica]|uniref:hypothetical protein n=1 Tax=Syntrophomonas palmitatica TaxID=402877 RepID=UPI0006D0092E|nr:hypothetical protein [Syntrophomonas palmitatica]